MKYSTEKCLLQNKYILGLTNVIQTLGYQEDVSFT